MNKLFYPALFHKAQEGGFWGSFPDIPKCLTQGDDMEQVYEMSVDALGLALTSYENEKQPFPHSSDPTTINTEPDSFLVQKFKHNASISCPGHKVRGSSFSYLSQQFISIFTAPAKGETQCRQCNSHTKNV